MRKLKKRYVCVMDFITSKVEAHHPPGGSNSDTMTLGVLSHSLLTYEIPPKDVGDLTISGKN
jgi:hypothetical protein